MRYLPQTASLFAAPFLAMAVSVAFATAAGAEVISFQDPGTGDNAYPAQDFEEKYSWADIYQLDDLDLGEPGWHLESAVLYWYFGIVEPEFYRIRTYSDLPPPTT